MKIHIIRDSEITDELYNEVLALLSNSKGILDFVPYQDYCVDISQELPSHEELFEYCLNFRKEFGSGNRIKKEEQVVLLTNKQNDQNWFSSPDFNGNLFIRCSLWNHFDLGCSDEFPIANEVVSTIFHSLLFTDIVDTEANVHMESVGCINDFCEYKPDIGLKMKTADICSSCLKLVKERKFSIPVFKHITSIIESLRSSLLAVNRYNSNLGLSRIKVKGNFDIELIDEGLTLSPKREDKLIYLFFLKHTEAIENTNGLTPYIDELRHLYKIILTETNADFTELFIINKIDNICDRLRVQQSISRLRSNFKDAVGEAKVESYCVYAPKKPNHAPYRLDLDRKLVSVPYSTSLSDYLNL